MQNTILMFKQLIFATTLLLSAVTFSQDTTWVQTFTFDSITSRRANFEFPATLDTMRFEKVLMYYKLKCSPLTTWDSYNCGEWDYLTYTQVIDHTGIFDSVQVDGNRYLANTLSPLSINYAPYPAVYHDTYVRQESNRSGAMTTTSVLNSTNGTTAFPFDVTNNGGRFQMLLSAAELTTAGITAGNIESLSLYLNALTVNGELKYPSISLKSTTNTALTSFENTGFTQVYNASHWASGSQSELVVGQNELLFYQSFAWNGTDNIIVEFYFENSQDALNSLLFDGETIASQTALNYNSNNGCIEFDATNHALLELSDFDLGDEMTLTFWSKGNGSAGTQTSILEAFDTLGNRVINIHMPWSDNNMYFDAGEGSGYDRISKLMTVAEIDNNWNHWAFVKKQSTGEMFVYKNGILWHSGTNKNLSIGNIHRFVLGSNMNQAFNWKGKIDDFQLYNVALDQTTIQSWMTAKPDVSHPNWSNLLAFYDFDNKLWAEDMSQNDNLLMPSELGMIKFGEYPNAGIQQATMRPMIGLGQGMAMGSLVISEHPENRLKEPTVIFEEQALDNYFDIISSDLGILGGNETVYNNLGNVVSQTPFVGSTTFNNSTITYYQQPYEIFKNVEIARYITPYGIQFDLGPNGFYWIYDVTDYQDYLKHTVDLAAHNTQELIDLKFAFIEGIPPRDVHKREPVWSNFRSYSFANLANDTDMAATNVVLSDSSEMFKIKTRFSGHGQVGNQACCEWVPNDHSFKVDGVSRFAWNIWEECGDNPNTEQGGTWPYDREGWCPGDIVKEYEFELTPYVTPGTTTSLDYAINAVPASDPGQASGNYIAAIDLISYSAPNFQNDAALIDVLNPNSWEYYRKWNPSCSNPRVVLQNTGALPLTSCKIRCWISYGDYLEYTWTGNLAFLEKQTVEIPVTDLGWWRDYSGEQTFHAQVYDIQGTPNLDEYDNNNVVKTQFNAPEGINGPFFVWLTTNNKASENNYRLEDASGNVIFSRSNMTNNTNYKDTFDLSPGCYSIIIEDTDSDGLGFWYSAQTEGETNGNMRLRLVGGTYISFFPVDWGGYYRYDFSVGFTLDVEDKVLDHEVMIFPNPTTGQCTIEVSGFVDNQADLAIYDLMGREVYAGAMNATSNFADTYLDLSHLPKGQYIVKIVTNNQVYTKNMIKQ